MVDMELLQTANSSVPAKADFVVLSDTTTASDYALKNLNAALGQAQVEFSPCVKDLKNAYAGFKYTPLTNIIEAIRPALTKNRLTIAQFPESDLARKTVKVVTRMTHWDSGEWTQSILEVPGDLALGKDGAPKFNQQTIGGSITYAQKFSLKAIAGIADDEEVIDAGDQKGNTQAQPAPRPQQTAQKAPAPAQRQQAAQTQQQAQQVDPAQQEQPVQLEVPAQEAQQAAPAAPAKVTFLSEASNYGWDLSSVRSYIKRNLPHVKSPSTMTPGEVTATLLIYSKMTPEAYFKAVEADQEGQ